MKPYQRRFTVPRRWSLQQRLDYWTDKSAGPDACWPWQGTIHHLGYGVTGYRGRQWRAHRLSWAATKGPIPPGMLVLHSCDNPPCVNPAHLWLGTHRDNSADCVAKGRNTRVLGEQHGIAKLTEKQVREILVDPRSHSATAATYAVNPSLIYQIRMGKIWTHVPRPDARAEIDRPAMQEAA